VGAGWSDIAEADDLDARAWSPAFMVGDQLLVSAHLGGAEASQLVPYDSARRQPAELPVLSSKGFDVGDTAIALVDDADRQPLGWRYRLDTVYTRWTDPMMAGMQAAIDKALPGRVNVIECHVCRGAKRWLVRSLADNQPPTYAVFEPASGRLTPVGLAYPDLPADRMGTRSFQRIPTRDGLDMPVYVTTPAQGQPGPKPAVVYVHGGPWSRVNLEWGDHWADSVPQFLASRGYVVIEPEFRGSTGYGHAHFEAGRGQWGLAMQDDLSDALKWAVNKGWVDAGRVCIMGASYGGYAALMGPVQAPGSYRCAISAVGVTDLPGILEDNKQHVSRNHQGFRFEKRHIGDPDKDRAQLERNSPLHRVADIQVPVLAAWGKDDQRVKLDQGRRFRDAASKAHLALEYVEYADEGHNWLKPETRIDFYTRAEKLLARTIGAASDATK
jgi:dipeptidyl aminopeptidase/acylaminoacyl peptidase